jgi:hypothetical protein
VHIIVAFFVVFIRTDIVFLYLSHIFSVESSCKKKTQRLFYMHNALSMLIKNGKKYINLILNAVGNSRHREIKIYVQAYKNNVNVHIYSMFFFCNFLKARSCLLLGTEFFMWKISQFSIACDDDK